MNNIGLICLGGVVARLKTFPLEELHNIRRCLQGIFVGSGDVAVSAQIRIEFAFNGSRIIAMLLAQKLDHSDRLIKITRPLTQRSIVNGGLRN